MALENVDCVVIGAGIAGLACAYYLERAGRQVVIVERSSRIGGWIETVSEAGFSLETGPNTALAKSELLTLISELGLDSQTITASAASKTRYVARELSKPLIPFPLSATQALTTDIVSSWGKLRLLLEPFIPRGKREDVSFEEFCQHRFGREVTKKVLAAVINGILAPDIAKLSARSAFPLLWELEQKHGSIVRGLIARRGQKTHKPRIISFNGGLNTLTESLAAKLNAAVRTTTTVTAVTPQDSKSIAVDIEHPQLGQTRLLARQVIATEDTAACYPWLARLNSSLAEEIKAIPYTSIGVVHFAAPSDNFKQPVRGFGFLVPPSAGLATLGTIFSSSLFPHVAPTGQVLLTTFAGGMRNREAADVNDPDKLARVRSEVSTLLGAKSDLQVLRAAHVDRAIPNPALGHYQLIERLHLFQEQVPTIRFLGNWLGGVSLNDRVREARSLAEGLRAR